VATPGSHLSVDIVITNHNYGKFVGQAIESANRQDHPDVRVIVVDDGSTDDSRDRLRDYDVLVVFKERGGQASAINTGLGLCQGDVVMLLDADDVLKPHAARTVSAVFARARDVVKVQFGMDVIDADGTPTGAVKPWPHLPRLNGDLRRAELAFPFDLPWLPTSGNAFRTDALRAILPIPEQDYPICGADWYVVHLTTLLGSVASIEEVCASFRAHGRNRYEPARPSLDLSHVHEAIHYGQVTARALVRMADQLGLDRPDEILSTADLAYRLISWRLEPHLHPVARDRTSRLVLAAVRSAQRRFDLAWPMKGLLVAWFAAVAVSPRGLVRRIAELFLFPETRASFNTMVNRFRRPDRLADRR
jgi:glycosyl transferase family 2